MKTIGFAIPKKPFERRRALLPADVASIENASQLYFEVGYGATLGISDSAYIDCGANVVGTSEVYEQDIVCNPKTPEVGERGLLREGQTLFGWIHAVQGRAITEVLVKKKMTALAWEDMYELGRHSFWRNNELAGEAAVLHASTYLGRVLYDCDVAVLGKGNCARGAVRVLEKLGARVTVYDRASIGHLRDELSRYDVVVNAVLWDVLNKTRLLTRQDLKLMRKGSLIIDVSCDEHLEIETSRATTVGDPVYCVDGILHYAVDNIATLFWESATEAISKVVCRFADDLVTGRHNPVLLRATVIEEGMVRDPRILAFQQL